jgi:hypothetical protein
VTTTTDDFLERFRNVRQINPRAWSAQCNRHVAPNDFLTVVRGDRGFHLDCRTGCSPAEVLRAHSLTVRDLLIEPDGESLLGTDGAMAESAAHDAGPREPAGAPLSSMLEAFVSALFGGVDSGSVECRALPSKTRRFLEVAQVSRVQEFVAAQRHENCYVGVAVRRDATSGELKNCTLLSAVFVDIDFKSLAEAAARAGLSRFALPPSLVVATGGGLHAYWLLREPLDLSFDGEMARQVLRRLARHLGADLKSAECAHILRLPDTRNYKYQPPRLVTLERHEPDRRYSASEILDLLPLEEDASDDRQVAPPVQEVLPEGTRDAALTSLAGTMRRRGLGELEIRAALLEVNRQRCQPPLPEADIFRIAGSVARYAPVGPLGARALLRPDEPAETLVAVLDPLEENLPPIGEVDSAGRPAGDRALALKREAFHGLAGRLVECIEPTSEADPAALLVHVLLGMGNLVGRNVHARVEKTIHPCNEFAVLVGQSAKGRKGQAWSTPRALFELVSPEWVKGRVRTGLSSGEGLIYHVRDKREELQPVKKGGKVVEYDRVIVDAGEDDKRLFVFESELAGVLRRMNGETSSLSAVMRQAWDSGDLSTLTRNNPLRATGAHVSVIAHVTREELIANLTETERANGFANRFLFCLVKRSKMLPEGGSVSDGLLLPLAEELRQVVAFAADPHELRRSPAARDMWAAVYPTLSEGEAGLLGAILARAEPHVLRLSLLYAVLDCAPAVEPEHLEAALALWEYAEASARAIFGGRSGIADEDVLVDAVRTRGRLSQTQISALFHRNKTTAQLEALLTLAEQGGKIRRTTVSPEGGRGRPVTVWEAV